MLDWPLFVSTFTLILVAEIPDKTALANVFLATTHHPLAVFIGAAAAFGVQSLVAVVFGSVFHVLPPTLVHYVAALVFLVFAAQMWRKKAEPETEGTQTSSGRNRFWRSTATAFVTIFIAEWGDLTQLATATLQARYNSALTIFLAATLALWTITAVGVLIGHHAKHLLSPHRMQRVAAVVMAAVGMYLLYGAATQSP